MPYARIQGARRRFLEYWIARPNRAATVTRISLQ